jgi:hypothetical protein
MFPEYQQPANALEGLKAEDPLARFVERLRTPAPDEFRPRLPYGPLAPAPEDEPATLSAPTLDPALSDLLRPRGPEGEKPLSDLSDFERLQRLAQQGVQQYRTLLTQAEEQGKAAASRRGQHEQFLAQLMTTDGVGRYLPKPSARQMLSDAMANFGMKRLTNGNFTPIQARRYEEAFKRHEADARNVQLALQSERNDELAASNAARQAMQMLTLNEKTLNDATRASQAQAETARKQAATDAMNQLKTAALRLTSAKNDKAADRQDAEIAYRKALTHAVENGGGNLYSTVGAMFDDLERNGQLPGTAQERNALRFELLAKGTDATKRATQSITEHWDYDKDGNRILFTGPKGGAKEQLTFTAPNGFGTFSPEAKRNVTQIMAAEDLAKDVKRILENVRTKNGKLLKDEGGADIWEALGASAQERLAYKAYIVGIGNAEDSLGVLSRVPKTGKPELDRLIQYAAMLKIIGAQPYLHGIRNMQYVGQIQTHLVNEEKDTGSMMYGKIEALLPQWKRMKNHIVRMEVNPISTATDDDDDPNAPTPPRQTPTPKQKPPKPPKPEAAEPDLIVVDGKVVANPAKKKN